MLGKEWADSMKSLSDAYKEVAEGLTGARQMRARQMQDSEIKKGGGTRTPQDRDTAFRLGTGTGPGRVSDRPITSQNVQGKGNAAKRRMEDVEIYHSLGDAYALMYEKKKDCKDGYHWDSDEKKCVKNKKGGGMAHGYGLHHHDHDDEPGEGETGGDGGVGGDGGGGGGGE